MELTIIIHENDNSISTLIDREQHQTVNNNWSTGIQKIRRLGKLTNIRIHSVSFKVHKQVTERSSSSMFKPQWQTKNKWLWRYQDLFLTEFRPKGFQWLFKKQLILTWIILTIDLIEYTSVGIKVSRLWTRPVAPDVNTKTKTEVSIKTKRIVKD